jgi:hypothetical protein
MMLLNITDNMFHPYGTISIVMVNILCLTLFAQTTDEGTLVANISKSIQFYVIFFLLFHLTVLFVC